MTVERQRGGRPRDSRVDHKILQTTRELIDEVGYPALTVDQVAARAGVGKAAIYRRYASKAEMAFVATMHEQQLPPPADTGSLHGDLLALVRAFHARMAAPAARQLAPALISELAVNPELDTRFTDTFLATEQAAFAESAGASADQHPPGKLLPHRRGRPLRPALDVAVDVEDVLSRRTRQLYLDARASLESASSVAEILHRENKKRRMT